MERRGSISSKRNETREKTPKHATINHQLNTHWQSDEVLQRTQQMEEWRGCER